MLRRSSLAVAVALALLPAAGYGLGLGQIHASSALNQPFEGDIDLQSVPADEIAQVKVKLAPPEAFAKAGVEMTGSLGKLVFKPYVKATGQSAIRVYSEETIREPFLDFLVEVEWPQGKAVKEYTVLLDPPTYTERRGGRVRPAETTRPAPTPATPPPEPRATHMASAAAAGAPVPPAEGGGQYGKVRRGETLWSIAERTKPAGVSTRQAVNAIYAANPKAFIRGDVNKLRAGADLYLPASQQMEVQDVQTARREYLEQAKEPAREKAGRGHAVVPAAPAPESPDHLRLLTPPPEMGATAASAPKPATTGPSALHQDLLIAQEKAESALQSAEQLHSRVNDLETQLRDMQRLVLLKDEQLAQLQRQGGMAPTPPPAVAHPTPRTDTPAAPLAPSATAAAEAHPPKTETPPAAATPPPGAEPAETPVAAAPVAATPAPAPAAAAEAVAVVQPEVPEARPVDPQPASVAAPTVAAKPAGEPAGASAPEPVASPAPVEEPAPVASVPARAARPPPAGSFAALLEDPTSLTGVGIAGIGVLGALLWALAGRRRRTEAAGAEAAPEPAAAASTPTPVTPAPSAEKKVVAIEPLAAAKAAPAVIKVETVEPERVSTEDLAALELSTTDLFGLKGETSEVDPTEEADVYIAYGRYEQAEQLLRLALEMEPNRLALRHKLLEVYFASRDASAFGALFSEMKAAGKEVEDPAAWQRALRMGRQLNPIDPAFAGTASDEQDLEAALRAAEQGLAADLDTAAPDLGELKIESRFAKPAPDLEGGSVLNDLSLDLGTEEHADRQSHPFNLDVSEELSELRASTGMTGELDEDDLAQTIGGSGGFSLEEITGQEVEQADERPPDLSGIDLTMESSGGDQDTTLMHADTTLELVDDVETKLDLARAYIELGDVEGARAMLREVMQEGNDAQRAGAEGMLKELS